MNKLLNIYVLYNVIINYTYVITYNNIKSVLELYRIFLYFDYTF